jgi:hypothetical protein
MFSQKQIVNNGLSKLGSSRVSRLDPPSTSLEKFVSEGYNQWKQTELAKRRWVFATEDDYELTRVPHVAKNGSKPYKFAIPADNVRLVRLSRTEWKQRGQFVFSDYEELYVTYVRNVAEALFDPLFCEVLSCRVAVECAEYVTQSNTKNAEASAKYDDAVRAAGQVNAFIIGAEDLSADDNDYPFITGRG